jgi:hypothetical protein
MSLYELTIPQLKKMLGNLERWLDAAVAFAEKKAFDPNTLLTARLAPDQFSFVRQVQATCDQAKSTASFLAGKEPPKHPDTEQTISELRTRIKTCLAYLDTFTPADFEGAATRNVKLYFLPGKVLSGQDFLVELGLPNFYFHLTTAYAILRHNGVDLGKRDFIGDLTVRDG